MPPDPAPPGAVAVSDAAGNGATDQNLHDLILRECDLPPSAHPWLIVAMHVQEALQAFLIQLVFLPL